MSDAIVATGAEKPKREYRRKRKVGTIDLTPSWRATVGVILVALENGTPEGKRLAREELYRLADIGDAYVAEQKAKGNQDAGK